MKLIKFTLKINLGNDAMTEPYQIAGELIRIGTLLKSPEMSNIENLYYPCGIRDINGNYIGYYQVE